MPSEKRNLLLAALLLAAASALFMTLNARGMWDFVLPLRAAKLLAILLVAYAIGVSTLLFQTLTHNPILTPSLLGFDTLYVFLQTLLVLVLGGIGYVQLNPAWKFSGEMLVMLGGSMLLFQVLLRQGGRDLARMILIGVIFGIFFRSITGLLQRLMDPEAFAVAQAFSYASFNSFNRQLLWPALLVVLISVPLAVARAPPPRCAPARPRPSRQPRHRLSAPHLMALGLGCRFGGHGHGAGGAVWLSGELFRPARLRAGQPFCRHAAPQCAPADGVSGGRAAAGGRANLV
jgi:hypothetical protein